MAHRRFDRRLATRLPFDTIGQRRLNGLHWPHWLQAVFIFRIRPFIAIQGTQRDTNECSGFRSLGGRAAVFFHLWVELDEHFFLSKASDDANAPAFLAPHRLVQGYVNTNGDALASRNTNQILDYRARFVYRQRWRCIGTPSFGNRPWLQADCASANARRLWLQTDSWQCGRDRAGERSRIKLSFFTKFLFNQGNRRAPVRAFLCGPRDLSNLYYRTAPRFARVHKKRSGGRNAIQETLLRPFLLRRTPPFAFSP